MTNMYEVDDCTVTRLREFTMLVAPNELVAKYIISVAYETAKQKSAYENKNNIFVCKLMRMIQDGLTFGVWPTQSREKTDA